MIEIKLIPHVGAIIQDNNKIYFGETTEEVKETLGKAAKALNSYYHNGLLSFYNTDYAKYLPAGAIHANNVQYFYDDLEIRVDFDADRKVEFIECITGPFTNRTKPFIYGEDVFKLCSNELLELLTVKNNGVIDVASPEKIYSFLEIDVGIFREMSEADAVEMIKEAKSEGTYELNKESYKSDLKKSCHFWTIGIGSKGYYRKAVEGLK